MRKQTLDRSPHAGVEVQAKPGCRTHLKLTSTNQEVDPRLARVRVQEALSRLAELQVTLASNQQELRAAQEQLHALATTNSRFRRKLIRLAQLAADARYFSYHDQLTGLPNRNLLLDRLEQAMVQARRQHKQVALLLLDLDGFKRVNDMLGHTAGDTLLQQVAGRLRACIRGGDTACRYGGDEFVVMLPEVDDEENATAVAEKIRVNLAAPYLLDGKTLTVTASVGIALYRGDEQHHSDDLIKQADIAMYLAKARGRLLTWPLGPQALAHPPLENVAKQRSHPSTQLQQ